MARREVEERERDGAPRRMGADTGRPHVGRGPSAAREEVGGPESFLPRPQGAEAVVGEAEAEYSVIL